MDEERTGGFLPPEPAGPEPELGRPPEPQPGGPEPPPTFASPTYAQPGTPPPQPYEQAPPTQPYPPPPAGWYQQPPPGWQPQPWAHSGPTEPDNGPAVAGFVLSLVAGGLLLLSFGLSSIVSIACAAFAIVYARKGRKKVDAGETPKHRGLAQAGFIIGIVSLALSVLATLSWLLVLILALTNEEFQRDLEKELDDSNSISAALRLGAAAVRLAGQLLR